MQYTIEHFNTYKSITKSKTEKNKKIYAFIDSNNLYQGILTDIPKVKYKGWKLNFKKLRIYLENKYNVEKAFLFIGYVKGNEQMYSQLQKDGYILIFKPTISYVDGNGKKTVKGNVDAELVLQAMIEFKNYDKAMIVAGDGDYKCLLEYLEKQRKLSHLLIPNQKMYSSLLIPFKKYMRYMNQLRTKLEY